jgi:hypothetical protein
MGKMVEMKEDSREQIWRSKGVGNTSKQFEKRVPGASGVSSCGSIEAFRNQVAD